MGHGRYRANRQKAGEHDKPAKLVEPKKVLVFVIDKGTTMNHPNKLNID